MSSNLKKTFLYVAVFLLIVIIAGLVSNFYLKTRIEKALNQALGKDYNIEYTDLSVNIFFAEVSCKNLNVKKDSSKISIKTLKLNGINWIAYLKSQQISIGKVEILEPTIKAANNLKLLHNKKEKDSGSQNEISFEIDEIDIKNGNISILDSIDFNVKQHASDFNFHLDGFNFNENHSAEKLPISYKSFSLKIDSIYTLSGQYDYLTGKNFYLDQDSLSSDSVVFKTKYDKRKFDRLLKKERDHYHVFAEQIGLKNWKCFYRNDSLNVGADQLYLKKVKAAIYRNKLLPDDNTIKPHFGELLKNLSFNLGIEKCTIANSEINYLEKTSKDFPPGELLFESFDAEITNLGNHFTDSPLLLKGKCRMMKNADLRFDWKIWVDHPSDKFLFKADIGEFEAEDINSFTVPNIFIGFNGKFLQSKINIAGTKYNSTIDMAMAYEGIKIKLLDKKSRKTKKVQTALINLVLKNDSKGLKQVQNTVKPDRTKSTFNYLWKNIKTGLKDLLMI
jgi:hypothetical protein